LNPFQRAREEALELRNKLLRKRSCEAVHVKDFLTPDIIERKLELGIAFVPQGSTDLGGADAILRRSENYIYVRNDVSNSEKTYLIAHELGHFVQGEGQEETSISSLKSLVAAEGSPGVIKVEAYGARERQELRANVFARELLLPRSVARDLYAAGVGPRKVATDFGIHLEIVRQQMLDAVLLPVLATANEMKALPAPSPDQDKAIRATERFVNVVAGPGSGKTTTLVHRVRYLIQEQNVDPSHLLVLTFTNKAAFELTERLRAAGIPRASDVWAGTFHAFGLEFLRKYHQCFGLENDVIVADKGSDDQGSLANF
jgi:Zn-dependent peptidase ImmA (M78 family)